MSDSEYRETEEGRRRRSWQNWSRDYRGPVQTNPNGQRFAVDDADDAYLISIGRSVPGVPRIW